MDISALKYIRQLRLIGLFNGTYKTMESYVVSKSKIV